MANRLAMALVESILSLHRQGWPGRRIARELGVDRGAVAKHIAAATCDSKPAKAPIGSDALPSGVGNEGTADNPGDHLDSNAAGESFPSDRQASDSKPAKAPIGSEAFSTPSSALSRDGHTAVSGDAVSLEAEGSRSACDPYRGVILEKLNQGLTAQRIYQDLVADGFEHAYHSVRRYVARLRHASPLPFRRMEKESGEEAQIDFGTGAWIEQPDGKRKRTHVLRVVLSYSRKGYSEVVYRQTTEDFICCIENAFAHFGGVPKVLVIDNLKAAVKHPDWYDPELVPRLQAFCEHYGCVVMPTKARTPRHKGKVENGVGYVQDNGLKGRRFKSLEQQNAHLLEWETTVADNRIHGTIRQQVGKLFEERERACLAPLPQARFPFFHEGRRTVHRDGHVEIARAYYSAPPEYLGHTVWVRWDVRQLFIFNERMERIAIHARQEAGRFSTQDLHIAAEKRSGVERGAAALLARARRYGRHTACWAETMLKTRGIEGVRVLQGLLVLANTHSDEAMERACEVAHSKSVYRLKTIRRLLKSDVPAQEVFEFLKEHEIIRSLKHYDNLISTAFDRSAASATTVISCSPSFTYEELLP